MRDPGASRALGEEGLAGPCDAEPVAGAVSDAREDRAAGSLYALVAGSSLGCSLRQKTRRELQA
ncbi:MAG: hypothetical protein IK061_02110, partial [Desulfovibrio sp.]|nr:hypothetical protein [Desulfovibrio sp.]